MKKRYVGKFVAMQVKLTVPEHLVITCPICEYSWGGKCVDHKEDE